MGTSLSIDKFDCCIPILEPNPVKKTQALCLSIPLVLRKILQDLSNNELIELSLVSKQWHTEARSLLENRGSLIANLNPYTPRTVTTFTRPRNDLAALASDLRRMNAALTSLSGISVKLGFVKCFDGSNMSLGKLDPTYDVILDRIKWRKLSVTIGPYWRHERNCQALQLVKKILEDKCEDLEEIALKAKAEPYLGEHLFQEFFQHKSFPRLKILTIGCWLRGFELNSVKILVSRAPNLEKLYACAAVLLENVLEGSSAVIVPTCEFNPFREFSPCLLNAIRIDSLWLMGSGWNLKMEDMQKFNEIMPVLLRNSWNTMTSVRMDLYFALHVLNSGISFVNMRDLTLVIHDNFYSVSQPVVLDYVKSIDISHIFPNVSTVNITLSYSYDISADEIAEFPEQGSTVLGEPKTDKAVNIKHLVFDGYAGHDKIKFLAQMFPNIQTLEVLLTRDSFTSCEAMSYGLIWEHCWPHLKKLKVDIRVNYVENLDSIFCGIHPEEVAELREKNHKYLKAVNIVPVMPAITCMKELRTLDLRLLYFEPPEWPMMLSKVTHLIAFKRCPFLSVTLR